MNTQILSAGFESRKRLILAFVAGLLGFMLLAASGAEAAAPDAKAREKGMKDTPALVADSKIPCDIVEAAHLGKANFSKGGKSVAGDYYEVSCKSGQGFILTRLSTGQADVAYNCLQALAYNAKNKGVPVCVLDSNKPGISWLTPVVQKATPKCVVSKARFLGELGDGGSIIRYEVGCEQGPGGIYDVPSASNPDQSKVAYHNCLKVLNTSSQCSYVTADEALKSMTPQIAKASATCTMNNFRYMGAADDATYYEVGCSNQAGFVLVTTPAGEYKSTASCAQAVNIGGCKYTDTATIVADMNGTYTKLLAKYAIPCTVKEFNVLGTQASSKRDLVEFSCPEATFGLIGFLPTEGSVAKPDMFDCFTALGRKIQAGKVKCTLISDETLFAQIKVMAKASAPEVKPDCVVKEVRYVGINEDNAVIVEIACVNKRGYLASMNTKRTAFDAAQPCTIAKKYPGEKCIIPENGTYTAP